MAEVEQELENLKAENKIRTRDRKEVAILVVPAACV
jgi:hypothetical protein